MQIQISWLAGSTLFAKAGHIWVQQHQGYQSYENSHILDFESWSTKPFAHSIFSYLSTKTYVLGTPSLGTSDEYPQCMFLWRRKKKKSIFLDEKITWSLN